MIICYIDGKQAVPTISGSIRLTRENPYIKDRDSYTYDITFPLDILENRVVFGAMNRLDTTKRNRTFSDCQLVADNVTVIRGTGTVTSVSASEIKLQILSGSSSVRYRSDFDKVYIDRIDNYPSIAPKYRPNVTRKAHVVSDAIDVDSEVRSKKYIGDLSTAVFMPVWDNSNNRMANEICISSQSRDWPQDVDAAYYLVNRAVQPRLLLVLERVLYYMGYTVTQNAYDVSPWNELFICSARQTAIIAKALPHWTVKKFLDEFRKLFNAVYLFDEKAKSVRILRADSIDLSRVVTYEPVDDFTSNYDDDGLEYLGSSNIRYNLSGLDDELLEVPDDVIENFDIQEYADDSSRSAAFAGMTERQKMTTLMVSPSGYAYGTVSGKDGQGRKVYQLRNFGFFTKMIRDGSSDATVDLNICPVALAEHEFRIFVVSFGGVWNLGDSLLVTALLPTVDNSEVLPDDGGEAVDEDELPYVTIEDVVEAGISAKAEEEEEEATMGLMWVSEECQRLVNGTNVLPLVIPNCFTDSRFGRSRKQGKNFSLALSQAGTIPHIGLLHRNAVHINAGGDIDANDELCIKFLCDGIPDPSAVYAFHNKRFLCSKVEANINADGIDRIKTGYFYEIL